VGAVNFSPLHLVQTDSGDDPASYPTSIGVSFPRDNAVGTWSWPLTSFWVPRSWIRGAIPPPPVRLHGVVLS